MRTLWTFAIAIIVLSTALLIVKDESSRSSLRSVFRDLSAKLGKMPPKGFFNDGRELALRNHVFSQDLDKLRGNPDAVMETIDAYMEEHGHMMTFKPSKVEVAVEVLTKSKPKTVVELGTYVGFSALAWGKMVKEFHPDLSGCKVVTMELSEEFAKITSEFIKLAALDDVVEVVQGQSADSLRNLVVHGIDKIDYLFIDHWEKYYLSDLQVCEELDLLHSGSVIIADNTDMPGAPDYLEYVKAGGRGRYRYSSTTYPTKGGKGPNVLEVTTVG